MYTINIKGKPNPKDPSMVKLEMIFFKSNYPRVIKVVNVTGLMSDWDAKSQSFRVGSAEATARTNVSSTLKPNTITKQTTGKSRDVVGLPFSFRTHLTRLNRYSQRYESSQYFR